MAYTPNKDRAVKGGIAQVSAQELADFRKQYGEKMGLRDLLNADKGLERREKTVYPQVEPKVKNQVSSDTVRNLASKGGVKMYANDFERNKGMRDDTVDENVKSTPKSVRRTSDENTEDLSDMGMKRGGKVKASSMGSVKTAKPSMGSASRRGDGIAQRGKTKGKYL